MIKLHDKYFKPFLSEEQILEAVKSIAQKVADDYKDEIPVFVGVLNGSFLLVADFLKEYKYNCEVFHKIKFLSRLDLDGNRRNFVGRT